MNKFSRHLDRIKTTKSGIETITNACADNIASASIACLWEVFFDVLFDSEGLTISDLNTLSGIFQKLIASDSQIKEDKINKENLANQVLALQQLRDMKLSEKILKQIEQQLKLI